MANHNLVSPTSVILASGGARGITARCVIKLAEKNRCKFILLGRSSLEEALPITEGLQDEAEIKKAILGHLRAGGEVPAPQRVQQIYKSIRSRREIHETLDAIKHAGGEAEYVSVDITDGPELHEKLAGPVSRLGQVTGIIHGAGNLADKLIEKKSSKDFETVYSPKIAGLENMLACVPLGQLDFLVLFSSIVGVFGNVGQSDYAMANEVLNKSAYLIKQSHPNCRVVSINWGPWDMGMVTPELKKMFAENNVEVIPADIGASILVDELAADRPDFVQVVIGNPPKRPNKTISHELKSYQIRRKLVLEANPFLYDHKIGEYPVLPATCAATWAASICEQLYPGLKFFSLENFKVLKGIVFDNKLAEEYILDLKETSKSPEGEITFDALIWSKNQQGKRHYHYSLSVKLVHEIPDVIFQPGDLIALLPDPDNEVILGDTLYKNGTLFHGPSFQGVERVLHVSRGKLVMQCISPKIDEHQQGQFQVQSSNPFIYDAIVQSLLIWSQYHYKAPCLPSRLDRLEQYKVIPFEQPCVVTMEIQSQTETSVVGNILVQDLKGVPYVRFIGLEGTISTQLKRFIGAPMESAQVIQNG